MPTAAATAASRRMHMCIRTRARMHAHALHRMHYLGCFTPYAHARKITPTTYLPPPTSHLLPPTSYRLPRGPPTAYRLPPVPPPTACLQDTSRTPYLLPPKTKSPSGAFVSRLSIGPPTAHRGLLPLPLLPPAACIQIERMVECMVESSAEGWHAGRHRDGGQHGGHRWCRWRGWAAILGKGVLSIP